MLLILFTGIERQNHLALMDRGIPRRGSNGLLLAVPEIVFRRLEKFHDERENAVVEPFPVHAKPTCEFLAWLRRTMRVDQSMHFLFGPFRPGNHAEQHELVGR